MGETLSVDEMVRLACDLEEEAARIMFEVRRRQAHENPEVLASNGYQDWQIRQFKETAEPCWSPRDGLFNSAVLEERERCARVAEMYKIDEAICIAAGIRVPCSDD